MKKIYFILAAAAMFLAVEANAQLGVGVGYNHINTTQKMADESDDESLDGFYIEATYDLNLLDANWGSLGLQPALRYTFGGDSESELNTRVSIAEHYLDIPVNVKYGYDVLPSKLKVFAFAGPVFSLGLSSVTSSSIDNSIGKKNLYTGTVKTKLNSETTKVKGDGTDYGRFDIKFGIGAGVTVAEKLNVKLGYNIGMLNRYTGELLKYKTHTGVFYLGVGFNF